MKISHNNGLWSDLILIVLSCRLSGDVEGDAELSYTDVPNVILSYIYVHISNQLNLKEKTQLHLTYSSFVGIYDAFGNAFLDLHI